MAGQSGRNTSISKHRLGCRLPCESSNIGDGYTNPGQVVVYKLSPEEIVKKYGPVNPSARIITAKSVEWAVNKAKTPRDAVALLQVSQNMLWQKINEFEIEIPEEWEAEMPMKDTAKKTRLEIAREVLTKEVYLELRAQGLKDTEIISKLGIANDVFYKIKKEFGLLEQVNQKQDQVDQPVTPQVIWVNKAFVTDSRPIITLDKSFKLNSTAKDFIAADFIKIGVMGRYLVIAPCRNAGGCYKMQRKRHSATIGGERLPRVLQELGLTQGKYQLTKDDQNGWWIGEKVSEGA